MRYVVLWKQNGLAANDASQRHVITAPQRKLAVPTHGQRRRAERTEF